MSNMFRRYLRRMGVWRRRPKRRRHPVVVDWGEVVVEGERIKKSKWLSFVRWLRKRLRF